MKIIASDYDGTLNHGGITDKKRAAIQRWRDAGNIFAIVSGRGPADALSILENDNLEIDYFVANNGAIVLDSKGERLCDVRCSGAIAIPFIKLMFECGCPCAMVHTDFPCRVNANEEERAEMGGYTLDDVPEIPYFTQINSFLPDDETAERVVGILKENFGDVLNPLQNGTCIDIVRADTDKAKGIYMLLDILGAEHGDVISVGDNINDSAMIAEFRSYAMENGVDAIKEIADATISCITELIEKEL